MSYVMLDTSDGVAQLTLNDPDRRNTVSQAMNDEIVAALDEIEPDPGIGALVVTGAGKGFCAGAVLDDLLAAESTGITRIYGGFLRVAHSPLATVAAVNGAAVGAGMNMVLACDIVLAGRRWARFDSRFLQIGLHPGGGHTWRLRHVTDRTTTMAMVIFGEVLSADDAHRAGLAYQVGRRRRSAGSGPRTGRTGRRPAQGARGPHQGDDPVTGRDRRLGRSGRPRAAPPALVHGAAGLQGPGAQAPVEDQLQGVSTGSRHMGQLLSTAGPGG